MRSHRSTMQGSDEGMRGWAKHAERTRPRVGGGYFVDCISVGQGLIELEVGDRFRIRGIESGGLIEPEVGLGRGAGRGQERRPAGKIEVGEDGTNGNGISDEGDDTHGSPARRAHEREDLIDAGNEGGPSRGGAAAWSGSVRRTPHGLSVELSCGRLLCGTLLTPEPDDLIPELGIGSQHPVIAVAMNAGRVNKQSEPLEELQRSERESRGAIRCGMWETIDDALASRRTVPGSLEPFEGERRTGTVAQESFEPSTVAGRDVNRRIDAEPTGGLPGEHVIGGVAFEQTAAAKGTEHAVAHGVLEFAPVGGREMGGLVKLDRPQGILAEYTVNDTDVEVEVCVQG